MAINFEAKSVESPSFGILAYCNGLECRNGNGRVNSDDDPSTSDINLVGSCPVIPELTRLNCVQQASISTGISSTTSARGQHC